MNEKANIALESAEFFFKEATKQFDAYNVAMDKGDYETATKCLQQHTLYGDRFEQEKDKYLALRGKKE